MAEALNVNLAQDWIEIMSSRFKIEIAPDRQPAFYNSLLNYAASISEPPARLLFRAAHRQLTSEHWAQIIHLATNHETRFYRYRPVIDLIARLSGEFARPRILSVGCSTGEEPYSFAVELCQNGFSNFHIHGTDVSPPCISTATNGIYKASEHIPERYAMRTGSGLMKFYGWLKDFVTFEQHNILSDRPIDFANPTTVVTQNMLIYYRRETRHLILDNLSFMIPKGGYLITGPAEDAQWSSPGFERLPNATASVFRKCQ